MGGREENREESDGVAMSTFHGTTVETGVTTISSVCLNLFIVY